MATGTVKWFDIKQNFGFIRPDNTTSEVILHISELDKAGIKLIDKFALNGIRISYDITTNENNKSIATNIKILNVNTIADKSSCINTGIIKWYDSTKKFGFIAPKDKSSNIFFHASELEKTKVAGLTKKNLLGAYINYEIRIDKKNRRSAINFHLLGKR